MVNSDSYFSRGLATVFGNTGLIYIRNDQFIYSILLSLASLILVVARWLNPSPNGFGTHQQLGLPPCIFLKLTGFPCPSCGMTTSFAHAARFNFFQSFVTQPFGFVLFLLTVVSIPTLIWLMLKRVTWTTVIESRETNLLFYFLVIAYGIGWLYKIFMMRLLHSSFFFSS